jgi:hypothetical protein
MDLAIASANVWRSSPQQSALISCSDTIIRQRMVGAPYPSALQGKP